MDTNICIYAMKGTFPSLNRRLLEEQENIFVSSVTVGDKTIASLIQASGNAKSSKALDTRGFVDLAFVDFVV